MWRCLLFTRCSFWESQNWGYLTLTLKGSVPCKGYPIFQLFSISNSFLSFMCILHMFMCGICVCLCEFVCVKACKQLLHMCVGVKEQPPVLVLAFHLVWGWVSLLFGPVYRRLAGPQASIHSPVSSPHLVAGSLGLQMCTTASCSMWLLGIQTQVLTFASLPTEATPQPPLKLLSSQYVIRWMLSAHCVQTVMPGLGKKWVWLDLTLGDLSVARSFRSLSLGFVSLTASYPALTNHKPLQPLWVVFPIYKRRELGISDPQGPAWAAVIPAFS